MGKVDENEMKSNRKILRVLAALLTLLLLCGCGAPAPAPAATEAAPAAKEDAGMTEGTQITVETPEDDSSPEEPGLIRVSTVDEFLAAIRPNATIELAAGEYDLSTASDYGLPTENPNYRWNLDPSYDGEGYELEILNVEGLSIRGAGREDTTIAAVPRYVNVIRFTGCPDLEIRDLTAGHTREAGICSGGVLYFERCSGVTVDGCGLYGCGTVGVWAVNCDELSVTGSHIYECSSSAVEVTNCRDVRVDGCEIYRMGRIQDWPAYALFAAHETDGFAAANCRIYDNDASILLLSDRTRNCLFLSNLLESNELDHAIEAYRYCPVVDGCLFADQAQISSWYAGTGTLAVDRSGNMLDDAAFSAMRYEKLGPDDVRLPEGLTEEAEPTAVPAGGTVTVTTADELLAAIGPDRTIVLDGADFALTKAENYGGIGTRYCYWSEVYDGPATCICRASPRATAGAWASAPGACCTLKTAGTCGWTPAGSTAAGSWASGPTAAAISSWTAARSMSAARAACGWTAPSASASPTAISTTCPAPPCPSAAAAAWSGTGTATATAPGIRTGEARWSPPLPSTTTRAPWSRRSPSPRRSG